MLIKDLAKIADNHFKTQIQQVELAIYLADVEKKVWNQMAFSNVNPKMEREIRENIKKIDEQELVLKDQIAIFEKEIQIVQGDIENGESQTKKGD